MPGDEAAGSQAGATAPVNSHNEWDPLEEVIVGRVDGATIPTSHPVVAYSIPPRAARALAVVGGLRQPRLLINRAQRDLDGFIALLKSLGVVVRQPQAVDHHRRFATPDWSARGYSNLFPRDGLLVVGDEIIETPMAWPCRYFETHCYRAMLKDYFRRGARWTSAPKPQLIEALFNSDVLQANQVGEDGFILTDFEPVFDAANVMRCGRDLFVVRNSTTNRMGIEWLRRHLGSRYRIHEIESRRHRLLHIDTTFMPLAPGKVLVNPEHIDAGRLPDVLKSWDVLIAPEPDPITDPLLRFLTLGNKWLNMNLLMLDPRRVIVDPHHVGMVRALERWGFETVPCPFMNYAVLGGAFHCATLDIRRRGTLESYF